MLIVLIAGVFAHVASADVSMLLSHISTVALNGPTAVNIGIDYLFFMNIGKIQL